MLAEWGTREDANAPGRKAQWIVDAHQLSKQRGYNRFLPGRRAHLVGPPGTPTTATAIRFIGHPQPVERPVCDMEGPSCDFTSPHATSPAGSRPARSSCTRG
jgi:hypothetical protein